MATAEQMKALLTSHAEGDDSRFYAVAMQVAASEAKRGHGDVAIQLRDLIDKAKLRGPSTDRHPTITPIASPHGELADLLTASYPAVRLSSMVLAPELGVRLNRVLVEQRQIGKLKANDLHPRQRLLFTGPPGCGKTMAATALAGELGIPLLVVRLDGLITKYMGETSAKLRLIFDAVEKTRAVYLFDEFDSIGTQRGVGNDVGEARRILNSFLMFLERPLGTSLIVAATNHASSLDSALFRRFDDLLEFPQPDNHLLEQAIRNRLSGINAMKRIKLSKALEAAKGMSFGEVIKACDSAIKEAVLDDRVLQIGDLVVAIEDRRAFLKRAG